MSRITIIILIAAALTASFTWWYSQHHSYTSTSTPSTSVSMNTQSVSWVNLSSAKIIAESDNAVALYDPKRSTFSIIIPASLRAGVIAFSPSGHVALIENQTARTLILVSTQTGEVLRSLAPWSDDRRVQSWAWSYDEKIVLIVSDRQNPDGGPIQDSVQLLRWTPERYDIIPGVEPKSHDAVYNLLSTDSAGTDILFGWTEERQVVLYRMIADGSATLLTGSGLERGADRRSSPVQLSAISHGHALFANNGKMFSIDVATGAMVERVASTWSHQPLTTVSQDGQSMLVIQKSDASSDQVLRYDFEQQRLTQLIPAFTDSSGWYSGTWIEANRYFLYQDPEYQIWTAVDTLDAAKPAYRVTAPFDIRQWRLIGTDSS